MSLSENLQNLRKIKNMSQEELAEKLNVSRQAVSKWESGNGYPETEKIISICEIFDCSMDELVKGKITADIKSEKNEYAEVMDKEAKYTSIGIFAILLGVSFMLTLLGLAPNEQAEDKFALIGVVLILIGVVFAVPLFIISGQKLENFKNKNQKIANIYSEEETEKQKEKYTKFVAGGVGIVLLGVTIMMLLIGLNVFGDSVLPVAILMYFVTIGVSILVYADKKKAKYDIERYNKENSEEYKKTNDLVGKICGVIMLVATIVFLIWGFAFNSWNINWIVFPIGGMLCGITGVILQKEPKE